MGRSIRSLVHLLRSKDTYFSPVFPRRPWTLKTWSIYLNRAMPIYQRASSMPKHYFTHRTWGTKGRHYSETRSRAGEPPQSLSVPPLQLGLSPLPSGLLRRAKPRFELSAWCDFNFLVGNDLRSRCSGTNPYQSSDVQGGTVLEGCVRIRSGANCGAEGAFRIGCGRERWKMKAWLYLSAVTQTIWIFSSVFNRGETILPPPFLGKATFPPVCDSGP